ncbi:putative peptidoglycan binding protein [Ancylobacter aquaticus]|uniref:Putative peptidoglycan binding protein n=1 Tax=Ancylobacter aquaticus TaxID=100 RepID=A0A4R1I8B9_ANCAQ|nr:peptidoglycan-binding domain-containing protein [Ancylobacter aquaticus]TCK31268.1 putative peptidoglycan binding protein [Ancylobacter aquaticus]
MPRSYASDLLVDDIDLDGERVAGRPYRHGRRRSDLFMLILAGGACAAVLFNALALQQGRPGSQGRGGAPASAPPDIRQVDTPRAASSTPAVSPPAPPAASIAVPALLPELLATPAVPTPLPPAKPAAPRAAASAAGPTAATASASTAEKAVAPPAGLLPPGDVPVSPRVMEIQKALARLGYGPIRIDGVFGAATEEAIQRFERDRRLPITGQMSERVVRELAAVSGFTIR